MQEASRWGATGFTDVGTRDWFSCCWYDKHGHPTDYEQGPVEYFLGEANRGKGFPTDLWNGELGV